jgi:hypothetical protein
MTTGGSSEMILDYSWGYSESDARGWMTGSETRSGTTKESLLRSSECSTNGSETSTGGSSIKCGELSGMSVIG